MDLVTILGPAAVGKATVGRHLADLTGYRLLHNNMSLELVTQFFPRGTPGFALYSEFNTRIIETAARNGAPNLIFTVVWALNSQADLELETYRHGVVEETGGRNFYVELVASQHERIRRNQLPDRRASKPLTAFLDADTIRDMEREYELNSDGAFPFEPHLMIDTESVASEAAAALIATQFGLARV